MKMQKLATAIVLSLSTMGVYAAPTLTGGLDLSIDYLPQNNNVGTDRDVTRVNSNSSWIGVKGEEKLNDRTSVLYAAEWGISIDSKTSDQTFTNRNIYVGVKDKQLGTLRVGNQDSPLKSLSSVADSFNNRIENRLDINGIMTAESRVANSLYYQTPDFAVGQGKLKVALLTATGEASGVDRVSGAVKVAGRGLGDAVSGSVTYTHDKFVLGAAYDKAIPTTFAGKGVLNAASREVTAPTAFAAANTVRLVARVNATDNLAVKGLYQTSEVEAKNGNAAAAQNIDDAQGWLLGVEYKLPQYNAFKVKGQYSHNITSYKTAGTADFEAQQYAIGLDYAVNKQVTAYTHAAYLTLEQGSAKDTQTAVGVGVEYKF